MKLNKLSKILTSSMILTSSICIAVPLASCSNNQQIAKVKIVDETKKQQSITSNTIATMTFELDKDGYLTNDILVTPVGENKDDLILSYDVSGKILTLTIRCPQPCADSYEYTFSLKFIHKDWNASIDGFKLSVTKTDELKTVNKINALLAEKDKQPTMSALITLLKANNIDLTSLATETATDQWVWDYDNNVVFVLTKDETVRTAPKDYVLNENKTSLWKMVNMSTSNSIGSQIDIFSSTTLYSQYLRPGQTLSTKDIEVCSGLDSAEYQELNLTFNKSASVTYTTPVIINTNKSSLEVKSSISDISHHGHLKTLTITEIPNNTYNEFGSIDARVVLNSGSMAVKDGAKINDIVVTSDAVKKVELESNATVGTVCTTTEVTKEITNIVDDSKVEETKKPAKKEQQDPEQVRYSGGFGTIKSPYAIANEQELIHCQEDVNSATLTKDNGLHFILISDITLTNNWTPIGNSTNPYYGTFDGKEYSISGLKISSTTAYNGLFGYTNGTPNASYSAKTDVWDYDNNQIKSDSITEDKYTTVIKNINLKNVDISVTNKQKYTGAIVGEAFNTIIDNCNIESGTIKAYKCVGGICGSMKSTTISNCTTGQLTITSDPGYNIGGICGTPSYDYAKAPESGEAIVNCINNANIICKPSGESTGGYCGGISGYVSTHSETYVGLIINNCVNNGALTAETTGTLSTCISGISGLSNNLFAMSNCVNNGSITATTNGSSTSYASGITQGANTILVNCTNNGEINANVDEVAGIFANEGGQGGTLKIISCSNNKTLTNTRDPAKVYNIASSIKDMILVNQNFDNVAALNAAISSAPSNTVSLTMKNVTVADTSDTPLNIPTSMSYVEADKKVCDSIAIAQTTNYSQMKLILPETNITVNDDCSNVYIDQRGDNSTITIGQQGKLYHAEVWGDQSKIINNGTVSAGLSINGKATYLENNGTTSNVAMSNIYSDVIVDKHLVNNGTIHKVGVGANEHVMSSLYSSTCNILIDNYGTIKYENQSATVLGYLASFSNVGNNIMNCYENSELNSNVQDFKFTVRNLKLNYKTGAKFIDQGVEKDWSNLHFNNVIITHIN